MSSSEDRRPAESRPRTARQRRVRLDRPLRGRPAPLRQGAGGQGRGRARLRRGAGADHHRRGASVLRQVRARGSPGAGHRAGGRGDADRDRDAGGGLRDAAGRGARPDGARALVPAPAGREPAERELPDEATAITQGMLRGASHESASAGRAADAADPGHRHLDRQPRDPQARPDRRPPAQAAGLVRGRRRRAPCRDGVVERGRAVHRGSGRPRSGAVLPPRPHRRSALWSQRRSRPALPERRRPHPASGRPAREGRGHQRSPRRDAHPPRHGFARRRQHGGVPDTDAVPRPASAARDGGVAVARLQQVDAGEAAVGGRPHQVPGRAALQHAGGVRAHRARRPPARRASSATPCPRRGMRRCTTTSTCGSTA